MTVESEPMTDETNPEVAATEAGKADLGETLLLGLIDAPDGPRAMLRFTDGDIETVAPGTYTREGEVVAIDETQVVIARGDGALVLKMPTG
ncbi:hypothetical protein [Histidinibacterium aquaticum]|uniref:Pilus assembly protein PilP n=1 Tax=Histidinibacterium aquaticum TaxID=2613962 RepID=A0A5J5GNJ6_9RHOB|nr:hypothetical protein [Histidinibacterium aquaticum]KAA9009869.1 hypothetical protein F3S47_00940 [Histidinibacterium aquaticum]